MEQIGYCLADAPDQQTWFKKVYPDEVYRREVMDEWRKCEVAGHATGSGWVHMVAKICCSSGDFKWFDIYESTLGASKVITFLDIDELYRNNEHMANLLSQKDILLKQRSPGPS